MRAVTWLRGAVWAAFAAVAAACSSGWEPAFDETAVPGQFDGVAIADADEALTFARAGAEGQRRVIVVSEYRDGAVRGVDLAAALGSEASDPIAVFDSRGYDRLRDLARAAPAAARVTIAAADLVAPVDLRAHHIAAATNFPEHAGDAGVENGPFLFAKLVQPSGPSDPVAAGGALLDYEVEIAWVTLTPLAPGTQAPFMGLVLCNDFTDRDTLLRAIDPWNVESGAGFTTGKSFPGYLPIGNLFVVPRDHRAFAAGLDLRLYVNGALRQRARADEMVWDFDAIIANAWAAKEVRWDHRGTPVGPLDGDAESIPARTLILSGTPHGTIFAGLRARHYGRGLAAWLLGGWNRPLPQHVVGAYVDDARAAGAYLRPGDRVELHVDRLGVLRNPIVP